MMDLPQRGEFMVFCTCRLIFRLIDSSKGFAQTFAYRNSLAELKCNNLGHLDGFMAYMVGNSKQCSYRDFLSTCILAWLMAQ